MTFHLTLRFRGTALHPGYYTAPTTLTMQPRRVSGFSLIEVLIALVVVALIIAAYITTAHSQSRTLSQLQESLYSQQVAWNQSVQYHIIEQKELRETDYPVEMIGHNWQVNIELENTLVANFFQVRVEVGPSKNQPTAVFVNYITR